MEQVCVGVLFFLFFFFFLNLHWLVLGFHTSTEWKAISCGSFLKVLYMPTPQLSTCQHMEGTLLLFLDEEVCVWQRFGSFCWLWRRYVPVHGQIWAAFSMLPHLLQLLSQPWRQRLPQPVQQLGELHVVVPVVAGQKRSAIRVHRWILSSFTLSKAFCFTFFQQLTPETFMRIKR